MTFLVVCHSIFASTKQHIYPWQQASLLGCLFKIRYKTMNGTSRGGKRFHYWRLFVSFLLLESFLFSPSLAGSATSKKLVIGVDGGTESIRACCFDATTGEVVGKSCAVPYVTKHPNPGWAEQDPDDWYENIGKAVRGAVGSIPKKTKHDICSICIDTTCCSVVALDEEGTPLRPCLLVSCPIDCQP